MSAGAVAAIAVAAKDRRRAAEQRRRREREAIQRRWQLERERLTETETIDFWQAVQALKAKQAAEQLRALRARPTTDVLRDRSQQPEEVVGVSSGRAYVSTGLFCLRPYHWPRRSAILLCESRPFDPIILLTILCNCLTMA